MSVPAASQCMRQPRLPAPARAGSRQLPALNNCVNAPCSAPQMVCVADEFRGDPQLLLRAIELQQQEKGQQNAAETRMLQLAALELGANLGPTKE